MIKLIINSYLTIFLSIGTAAFMMFVLGLYLICKPRGKYQKENDEGDEKENSNLKVADSRSLNSENMEEVDLDDEKSNSNGKSKSASVIEFKGPELEKPLQAANEEKNESQTTNNDDQPKVILYTYML